MAQLRVIDPNRPHARETAKQRIADYKKAVGQLGLTATDFIESRQAQMHQRWKPEDVRRVVGVDLESEHDWNMAQRQQRARVGYILLGVACLAFFGYVVVRSL
jgi:hypothetical protein